MGSAQASHTTYTAQFVHLHTHSGYSLLEGTAMPGALVSMARGLKMPALGLTDRNSLYGVVPFYRQALKDTIKPIIGMEVDLDDGSSLVLLARNMDGYSNLCHMASIMGLNADPATFQPAGFDEEDDPEIPAWDPGVWGVPVFGLTSRPNAPGSATPTPIPRTGKERRLPRELILSGRHVRGLIALSGGRRGLVNTLVRQGKLERASRAAGMLLSAFGEGNFFIELSALDEPDLAALPRLVELANEMGVPIVATNDVLYLQPEDAPTALALAAVRRGSTALGMALREPVLKVSPEGQLQAHADLQDEVGTERYFKSPEQMAELFGAYPQALANTRFIADQCNVELPLNRPLFPAITLRRGETPYSRLWKLCFAGATRRYKPLTEGAISRLKYELEVIEKLGFSTYFLVVHDIVHFAHSRDIPILARGSAANSLVAYVLGITQVDPLAHNLLFERFLNPSRTEFELPDVDLDLCWRRRDEVLHYVYERYGRDHTAIVGTHITFRLRSAWREMAKALGIPTNRVGYIATRLPDLTTAEDILEGEEEIPNVADMVQDTDNTPTPRFRDETERKAFELCKAIEGLPRHAGMHCGGMAITPGPIADLVPLQRAARDPDLAITQYDKDALEAMGLVKMDLLGSRALTTLVDTVQASGIAEGKRDFYGSLELIPFDDEMTYRMMAEGNTLACFQLESPGMRALLKWLRPRNLNDIACAISLFRPGPLEGGFLEAFMRRHLRQEPVTYHHPSMEPILKDTYGVILYQEQFLQLVHILAGLDLGEAEKLRKDLGKARTADERARLGSWFIAGSIERGIDQLQAEKVWEIVAGYSGFGFCKAHACSYALTAYRSAYMKAHYPAQYMAAQLNNGGGFYGPTVYVEEARRLRIKLLPPHINHSGALCEAPQGKREIRFGLQFVKGLSDKAISAILTERRANGPFRSLPDLLQRVILTPPEANALVRSGACDHLDRSGSLEAPDLPDTLRLVPLHGRMGESVSAIYQRPLNRKQLLWLLPTLLSTRSRRARGTFNLLRAGAWPGFLSGAATGSEGPAVQIVMGDLTDMPNHAGSDPPRVLGNHEGFTIDVPHMDDFTPTEKLRLEQSAFGFPISLNQMDLHTALLAEQGIIPSHLLSRHANREVTIAGTVVAGRRDMTHNGEWMLFVTLQDASGLVEAVLFPEVYRQHRELLARCGHGPYFVTGQVQVTGKGRGIGVQPPPDLHIRASEALSMKMHPVVIAATLKPLE